MAWVWLIIFLLMFINNLTIIKNDKTETTRLDLKTINYFIITVVSMYSVKLGFALIITTLLVINLSIKKIKITEKHVKLAEHSITLTFITAGFILWAVPLNLIISNEWVVITLSSILGIFTVKMIIKE